MEVVDPGLLADKDFIIKAMTVRCLLCTSMEGGCLGALTKLDKRTILNLL